MEFENILHLQLVSALQKWDPAAEGKKHQYQDSGDLSSEKKTGKCYFFGSLNTPCVVLAVFKGRN